MLRSSAATCGARTTFVLTLITLLAAGTCPAADRFKPVQDNVRQGTTDDEDPNGETEGEVFTPGGWIGRHQMEDGGWSFRHRLKSCPDSCCDEGSLENARNAATGLALLALMSSGSTHKKGDCQPFLKRGLEFLIKQQADDGSLCDEDGRMYSHGLASLAIFEAYARTKDGALREPAKKAMDFILAAQDPHGGGWRHRPRQAGDTAVTYWQVTSLRVASAGGFEIPRETWRKAGGFLDSMQTDDGAAYGYDKPGDSPSCTAMGLTCRLHLGWQPDDDAFRRGMDRLLDGGLVKDDVYHNFVVTRLIRHDPISDDRRESHRQWLGDIRDHLVATQERSGHELGTWHFDSGYGKHGGRLYSTTLAVLSFAAYYAHLETFHFYRPAIILPRK